MHSILEPGPEAHVSEAADCRFRQRSVLYTKAAGAYTQLRIVKAALNSTTFVVCSQAAASSRGLFSSEKLCEMKLLYICLLGLCALQLGCATPTVSMSMTDPEDCPFIRRDPPDCTVDAEDCSYFVGIKYNKDNPKYLDFYLEGRKWGGWVAICFTCTKSMVSKKNRAFNCRAGF